MTCYKRQSAHVRVPHSISICVALSTTPDGTEVKELWRAYDPVPNSERQYGFTEFSMTLNEEDETVKCPTDSRKRTDQRRLEEGLVDDASSEKFRLEEKQRATRKKREARKEKWKPL